MNNISISTRDYYGMLSTNNNQLKMKYQALLLCASICVFSSSIKAADPADLSDPDEPLSTAGEEGPESEHWGLSLDASAIGDYSSVLGGGVNPGANAARYLIQTGVMLDTEAAFDWPGGELYAAYLGFHGDNGSLDSGDAQVYSNIDDAPFDALYSLWYRQTLFHDRLAIKLGKMDANSDFAYVDYGVLFIHSSPGFSPTIQAFPSYPDPATAMNVFAGTDTGFYAGVGVYDGATQSGARTGTRGPSSFVSDPNRLFWIGEAGTRYNWAGHADQPGRIGFGYWQHTGEFETFDGGTSEHADGGYLVWDQTLYSAATSRREIGTFAQFGFAGDDSSEIVTHASAGLQINAFLNERPEDISGVMASYVEFTDAPGADFYDDYELALECFHAFHANGWLVIQPDVQYIVNPGGVGLNNALVATLRAVVAL